MVKLEDAVTARYTFAGHRYEVLVDPNLASELKIGKQVEMNDLLAEDAVFKDASTGEKQSETLLKETFKTLDVQKIAQAIITKGDVQLTTQQRKEFKERKTREIITMIVRNAVNPQTGAPHTEQRILIAMEEARINIDPFKSASQQFNEIIAELRKLLPISIEKARLAVKVPAIHAPKAMGLLRQYTLIKEEWQNDGSLIAVIEVPAGLKTQTMGKFQAITSGEADFREVKQ